MLHRDEANAPIKVAITGAAGNIGYALAPLIANGMTFGPKQRVVLHLLDLPQSIKVLEGIAAELEDGAYPLLEHVVTTSDPDIAFTDIDWALLVGAFPRGPGMERSDLLARNLSIFSAQGAVLNRCAKRSVRVLVVGNPANTNALVTKLNAPDLPSHNFAALTRLDHQRAQALLGKALDVPANKIQRVMIWGNHSGTQVPDIRYARVTGWDETQSKEAIENILKNKDWYRGYVSDVQQRGAKIIKMLGRSSALSAAGAVANCVRDWFLGTPEGDWTSMAIFSDGNSYGVAPGLFFSFPVTVGPDGIPKIASGLDVSDPLVRDQIMATEEELRAEKQLAKL